MCQTILYIPSVSLCPAVVVTDVVDVAAAVVVVVVLLVVVDPKEKNLSKVNTKH